MKLLSLGNGTSARKRSSSESIKNTRGRGWETTTYCTQDNEPFKDVLSTFLAEALCTSVCLGLEYTEGKDVPPLLISQTKGSSPFHLPPLLSNANASHPHDRHTVLASGRRLRKENGAGTFSLRPKEDTEQVLGDAKMAASLMARCGRLPAFKALSQQAWGLQCMPSVYVCTKPGDSKKGFPKDKGKVITNCKPDAAVKLTDEDLRKFLAMKTLVMFPQKAALPFEGKPVFSSKEELGKRLTDEESFSSSSSESDSSSDSEDDDFRAKPRRQRKLCHTTDNKQLESDMIKTASRQRPKEIHLKSKNLGRVNDESQKPTEVSSESLDVTLSETDPQRTRLVPPPQNISQNLEQDGNITQKMQKTEMQDRVFEEPGPEVSRERTPVIKTTLKEEVIPEVEAQIEEQSTPQAAKPSPETAQETYDVSTYKNLQHHEYQPFTFVDFDVLLSKFRLPQPSSGRLSPRH